MLEVWKEYGWVIMKILKHTEDHWHINPAACWQSKHIQSLWPLLNVAQILLFFYKMFFFKCHVRLEKLLSIHGGVRPFVVVYLALWQDLLGVFEPVVSPMLYHLGWPSYEHQPPESYKMLVIRHFFFPGSFSFFESRPKDRGCCVNQTVKPPEAHLWFVILG